MKYVYFDFLNFLSLIDFFKGGRMDGSGVNHSSQFTKFANFVGIPAVSCPMGTCKNGLPVGFHLMSSWVWCNL